MVHRSDGSGTTFIFTNYLSKVSPDWKSKVGENTSVQWPTGVGGKGNEGVAHMCSASRADRLRRICLRLQNKMTYALLENREGKFVAPTERASRPRPPAPSGTAPGFYEILTDEPGKDSWPITGATFILMHKYQTRSGQRPRMY